MAHAWDLTSHVLQAHDSHTPVFPCAQLLRDAASRGGHMAHAAGTSPPPPTAPLGASGAETIKEFEARAPDDSAYPWEPSPLGARRP